MKKFVLALLVICLSATVAFSSTPTSTSKSLNAGLDALKEAAKEELKDAVKETLTEALAPEKDSPKFHIGIMTGTVSQGEDDLRGAELMIKKYGSTADGGMITHVTYPDNFMSEQETTVSQILGLADDPLMKVIVVNQGVPGTAAAFRQVRERRSDIIVLDGEPHEDANVTTVVADFVTQADIVNRGYLIPYTAKMLGAKTFVHVSFPRHMSSEFLGRRRAIMEVACKDLGIDFVFETSPDPTSDVGVAGGQQFILEHMPAWIEKYGKDTAFFCTNDSQTEPLLRRVAELGAIFVEADLPSPLMGYPGAFGIDLSTESGDWPAIIKKIEDVVIQAGGGGRMGTWAWSYGYTTTAALAEFGKRVVEGTAKLDSTSDLLACFNELTPGAKWNFCYWTDAATGVRNDKLVMVYQDTYVFGKGYMNIADVEVPEKYATISK